MKAGLVMALVLGTAAGFMRPVSRPVRLARGAEVTKGEAEKVVNLAKQSIARDKQVAQELGKLQRVQNILGYGSPSPGVVAVSFNASFQRGGQTFFTMSGEEKKANRGATVGKVSAKAQGSRLVSCVIAKDGGWGKSLNVAV